MNTVTAHCLVKNEENFIYYAVKSVIDFVDCVLVFDTGSTDETVELIKKLMAEYPGKIIFEEKGPADGARHTLLRQEMIDRTKTDWFMILDGDEIWTKRAMAEATKATLEDGNLECLIAPFYLCVGDIYHVYSGKRSITILGKTDFHYPRFIKIAPGLHWQGVYNQDTLLSANNKEFCQRENSRFMTNRYWHVTHLRRSSADDNDYSSGGNRKGKRRLTFFVIGAKINEPVPEVFGNANIYKMNFIMSFVNFIALIFHKLL